MSAIPLIRAAALSPYFEGLDSIGVPFEAFLDAVRLPRAGELRPDVAIPYQQVLDFIAVTARALGAETLPAAIARKANLDHLGSWGRLLGRSKTLGEFLQTVTETSWMHTNAGLRGRIAERILSRLDLPESVQVGGSQAVLEDVESWTDGIVGFRIGGDLTETVSLSYRTDIGGFGWGDSSDFTWQVMTGVQWRFTENWVAALDWRILGFDRAKVENAFFYGALLGVGYRF